MSGQYNAVVLFDYEGEEETELTVSQDQGRLSIDVIEGILLFFIFTHSGRRRGRK